MAGTEGPQEEHPHWVVSVMKETKGESSPNDVGTSFMLGASKRERERERRPPPSRSGGGGRPIESSPTATFCLPAELLLRRVIIIKPNFLSFIFYFHFFILAKGGMRPGLLGRCQAVCPDQLPAATFFLS